MTGSLKRSAIILTVFILVAFAAPANALKVGDTAPNIQAKAALDGKIVDFDLQTALAKNAVILYFFPKAFSQG